MLKNSVNEFYHILKDNNEYKLKLQKRADVVDSLESLRDFLEKEIVPVAIKEGFDFTVDDLIDYEKNLSTASQQLNEEDIDQIYGGVSLKSFLSLGFLSLSLGQILLNTAVPAKAALTADDVRSSYSSIQKIDKFKPSDDEEQITLDNIDWEYIKILNLEIGDVALRTNVVKNFRFYNGYIDKITLDENGQRDYKRDAGPGSASIMTSLFPSSSGELSSEGGGLNDFHFSHSCNPSAESMAKLFGIIHYMRNNKLEEKNLKIILNFEDKSIRNVPVQLNLRKKVQELLTEIKQHASTKSQNVNKLIKNLVMNIFTMINEQENNTDIPKYTLERMLLAYFVSHFNNQNDVKTFYEGLQTQITIKDPNQNANPSKEEVLAYLKKLHEVHQKIPKFSIPYTSKLIQNGSACTFKLSNDTGNQREGKFDSSSTFSDCADTAARHVLNLLTYNPKGKFDFIPTPSETSEELDFESLIKEGKPFEFKSLKERIALFYKYQTPDKANDGDDISRTLWNYVIGNMDKDENLDDKSNMYKIRYAGDKGYELDTGFINLLKLYYNIACSISGPEACKEAKDSIDNLITALAEENINQKVIDSQLEDAMKKTFVLFSSKGININLSGIRFEGKDLFGKVCVSVGSTEDNNLFSFGINQDSGHAFITFNFKGEIVFGEKENKDSYLENKDALLLYNVNNEIGLNTEAIGSFNKEFSAEDFSKADSERLFYKEANMVKLYDDLRKLGEHDIGSAFDVIKSFGGKINWESNLKVGDEKITAWIFNRFINNQVFMIKYLEQSDYKDEYIEQNFDKEIFERSRNFVKIRDEIKNGNISEESLENVMPQVLEGYIDNEPLLFVAIDKLDAGTFKKLMNKIGQMPLNCSKYLEGNHINAYEYAAIKGEWSKLEQMIKVTNGTIPNYHKFTVSQKETSLFDFIVENGQSDLILQNTEKFSVFDLLSLNGEEIQRAVAGRQNEFTQVQFVDGYYYRNMYVCAATKGEWSKLEQMIKVTDEKILNYEFTVDQKETSLVEFIVEKGQSYLILQNTEKFSLFDLLRLNLNDEEFQSVVEGRQQNEFTWGRSVGSYGEINAYEYAAIKGEWNKLEQMIKATDGEIHNNKFTVNEKETLLVDFLVEKGHKDLILQNAEKFPVFDLLSLSDEDFQRIVAQVQEKFRWSDSNGYIYVNAYEYAAIKGEWNKLEQMIKATDGAIPNYNKFTVNEKETSLFDFLIEKGHKDLILQNADKFSICDLLRLNLNDEEFKSTVEGRQNEFTWGRPVGSYGEINAYEYAAIKGEWNKLEQMIKATDGIIPNYNKFTVNQKETSLVEFLVEKGHKDLILQNAEKFPYVDIDAL